MTKRKPPAPDVGEDIQKLRSRQGIGAKYTRAVNNVTQALGSGPSVGVAAAIILIWLASGPIAGFSDTWQLVINTLTTLVTFIMVFIIQNAQNRDGRAMQIKLDEILRAVTGAEGDLADAEDLSQRDLKQLQEKVRKAAEQGGDS